MDLCTLPQFFFPTNIANLVYGLGLCHYSTPHFFSSSLQTIVQFLSLRLRQAPGFFFFFFFFFSFTPRFFFPFFTSFLQLFFFQPQYLFCVWPARRVSRMTAFTVSTFNHNMNANLSIAFLHPTTLN